MCVRQKFAILYLYHRPKISRRKGTHEVRDAAEEKVTRGRLQ